MLQKAVVDDDSMMRGRQKGGDRLQEILPDLRMVVKEPIHIKRSFPMQPRNILEFNDATWQELDPDRGRRHNGWD